MFVDGDSIGALCGRAVMANDVEKLRSVSSRIDAAQEFIQSWCAQVGGIKISGGGDEASMQIPESSREKIKELRSGIEKSFGYTISVGVGKSLSEAGTALLVAKLRGKNRVVYFNKHIKEDIKKAKRRVREKRASQEEYKLAEAYLEKSESMKLCKLHKGPTRDQYGSTATTGHEKGVHVGTEFRETDKKSAGQSDTGNHLDDHRNSRLPADLRADSMKYAKEGHKKVLSEIKAMPKPNLGKVENTKLCNLHKSKLCDTHKSAHSHHIHKNDDFAPKHNHENEDDRSDDCALCQDLDAQENADGTAGMHDNCPACLELDQQSGNSEGIDDCPYCQTENITEAQANPQHDDNCDCPWCIEYDQENGAEGTADDHPDNCPQCQEMFGDAIENSPAQTGQEDPNMQGHETAEEVLNLLDQEPGSEAQDPIQEARQIDNTEMPQGDQMKDNTSVKSNFGPAQAQNVSDSDQNFQQATDPQSDDDQPDMLGVLQDGLQDGQDQENRERVVNMVAQTLQQFKANKQSLEATRQQNEGLYTSCVQMLKSMIELCKLLGLEPSATPVSQSPAPTQQSPQQQSTPPANPMQQKAAPAEGAAPDPKTQS